MGPCRIKFGFIVSLLKAWSYHNIDGRKDRAPDGIRRASRRGPTPTFFSLTADFDDCGQLRHVAVGFVVYNHRRVEWHGICTFERKGGYAASSRRESYVWSYILGHTFAFLTELVVERNVFDEDEYVLYLYRFYDQPWANSNSYLMTCLKSFYTT